MRVQVLFFGQLKEAAGRERDTLELPEGARVADLLRRYAEVKPALQPYYDVMAVALNQEYSQPEAALHEGDEVALIPPVSGGSGKKPNPAPAPHNRKAAGGGARVTRERDDAALHARSLEPEGPRDDALLRRAAAGEGARATKNPADPGGGNLGGGETPRRQPARRRRYARVVWEKIDTAAVVEGIKRPEDGAVAVFEGIVRNHSRNRRTLYLGYEAYEPMALKKLEELAEQAVAQFAVREVAIVHRLGRLEIGETSVLIVVASAHRGAAFDGCRWLIDTLKKTVPIWKKEHFEDGAVWADGEAFPEEIAKPGDISSTVRNKPASK
jgi:molybdopterin converting factor subunit 1